MKNQPENPIATITALSHDGRGIARVNGKTTFIFGALPNETVRFRYLNRHSKYDEGQVTEIITPATNRLTADCPYFGICGGCNLQHLSSIEQIKHKEQVLLELLHHQAHIKPEHLLEPLTGPTLHYRRKTRLSVKYIPSSDQIKLGFYEVNGRYIADIDHCKTLDVNVANKIAELRQLISTLNAKQYIPQLEIAVADNATAIILRHLRYLTPEDLALLINFGKSHRAHIFLQSAGTDSITLLYPSLSEPLFYELKKYHLKLEFHPAQFIQVNATLNEKLITRAIELLDPQSTDVILDLFCGIGNFTLPVAKYCQQIEGVDADKESIAQAIHNAELNQITNARFYRQNLFHSGRINSLLHTHYDKLLIDPPRTGADVVIKNIPLWQPKRIVYVSCNPATFARDAKILVNFGYRLTTAGVQDMFPHTKHVETIGLFEK